MRSAFRSKGFTLIELMIVVSIIGILSVLAIPNFQNFRSKAMQAEARANLAAIHTCELVYFSDFNAFVSDEDAFTEINYIPVSGVKRYMYILGEDSLLPEFPLDSPPAGIAGSQMGFTAIAAGNIDADPFIDFWAVNDQRDIRNQSNDGSAWGADGSDVRN